MQVIFTDNVKGVANKGDTKKVADGYFRNFLMPHKLAVRATKQEQDRWEKLREKLVIEKRQLVEKAGEVAKRLAEVTLKLSKKVTKTGKLYGGLHKKDIVDALNDQVKIEVTEDAVMLKEPIKEVGNFEVSLKLADEVMATVKLEIIAEA